MRPSLLLSLFAALLFAACDSSDPAADSGPSGGAGSGGTNSGGSGPGGSGGTNSGGSGGASTGGSGGEPLVCDPACDPGHRCTRGVCQPRFEIAVLSPARDEVVGPRFTLRLRVAPSGPDVSELPTFALNLRSGDAVLPLSLTQGVAPYTWLAEVDASSLGADDLLPLSLDGSIVTLDGGLELPAYTFFADTLAPRVTLVGAPVEPVRRDGAVTLAVNFAEAHPATALDAVLFGALPDGELRAMEPKDCTLTGTVTAATEPGLFEFSIPARQPGLVVDGAEAGFRFGVCVRDAYDNRAVLELSQEVVVTRRAFSVDSGSVALTSPAILPDGSFAFGAANAVSNFRLVPAEGGVSTTLTLGADGAITFAPVVFEGMLFVAKQRSLVVKDAQSIGGADLWACQTAPGNIQGGLAVGLLADGSTPLVATTRGASLLTFSRIDGDGCRSDEAGSLGVNDATPAVSASGAFLVGGTDARSLSRWESLDPTWPTLTEIESWDGRPNIHSVRRDLALDGSRVWIAPTEFSAYVGFREFPDPTSTGDQVAHASSNSAAPIVSSDVVVFATESGLLFTPRSPVFPLAVTEVAIAAGIPGSPVAGSDGLVYAVDAEGTVHAVAAPGPANGGLRYSAPLSLDGALTIATSPTLTSTGILVIGDTAGTVHGFITDATSGLDPNAPWPKYQHDAGNSGNAAAPLYPQ